MLPYLVTDTFQPAVFRLPANDVALGQTAGETACSEGRAPTLQMFRANRVSRQTHMGHRLLASAWGSPKSERSLMRTVGLESPFEQEKC